LPPRDLVPADTSYREPPKVTLIDKQLPAPLNLAEFDYAEPSPVMGFFSRMKRRVIFLFKATAVAALVGTYPAMMVMSHSIDDSQVMFADGHEWSVPEVGVSMMMLARELEGNQWASDRDWWHPQARLTAMPAWQEGIAHSVADHTRWAATETGDPDLASASRLLVPEGGMMRDRLTAAAEALARYDARVESDTAKRPDGARALAGSLRLMAGWGEASEARLSEQIMSNSGWPASREDVRAFYEAKARAHVAHEILMVTLRHEGRTIAERGLGPQSRDLLEKYRRAAIQKPLFVSNQRGDGIVLTNHLTGMAFLMSEASEASALLASALEQPLETGDAADAVAALDDTPAQ